MICQQCNRISKAFCVKSSRNFDWWVIERREFRLKNFQFWIEHEIFGNFITIFCTFWSDRIESINTLLNISIHCVLFERIEKKKFLYDFSILFRVKIKKFCWSIVIAIASMKYIHCRHRTVIQKTITNSYLFTFLMFCWFSFHFFIFFIRCVQIKISDIFIPFIVFIFSCFVSFEERISCIWNELDSLLAWCSG